MWIELPSRADELVLLLLLLGRQSSCCSLLHEFYVVLISQRTEEWSKMRNWIGMVLLFLCYWSCLWICDHWSAECNQQEEAEEGPRWVAFLGKKWDNGGRKWDEGVNEWVKEWMDRRVVVALVVVVVVVARNQVKVERWTDAVVKDNEIGSSISSSLPFPGQYTIQENRTINWWKRANFVSLR